MDRPYDQHPAFLPARIDGTVALDTETSGLHTDDGARVAVVSLAWQQHGADGCTALLDDIVVATTGEHIRRVATPHAVYLDVPFYDCDNPGCLHAVAYPFDQGVTGKPEDDGQTTLFGDANNLDAAAWTDLIAWLSARRITYHNALFDALIMRAGHREFGLGVNLLPKFAWDTQLTNRELHPRENTSLKPTAARLWGEEERSNEAEVKNYLRRHKLPPGRYDLVPWSIIDPYATSDAHQTKRLEQAQLRKIYRLGDQHRKKTLEWIRREFDVMQVLYAMETRGLPYPAERSFEIARALKQKRAAIATALPFTPTEAGAKQYYFDTGQTARGVECLGLTPYAVSEKTQAPSLTADILARMVDDGAPHAQAWADYARLSTAISLWYEGYAVKTNPQDKRLRTHFRQLQVKSGRFSVERVNLQAIPSDFKMIGKGTSPLQGFATPRNLIAWAVQQFCPGWDLWEMDLAQAELRLAAHYAGCKRMLDMVKRKEDLHGYTATQVHQVYPDHPDWKLYRQLGKRENFSCVFGAGAETVQKMVLSDSGIRVPLYEMEKSVRGWNELYPEFSAALDSTEQLVKRQRKVRLANGKSSYFQVYDDYRSGFSRRVQGSLAEVGKDIDLLVERRLGEWGVQERADLSKEAKIGGAGLLLAVHDSQLMLLPRDGGQEMVELLIAEAAALATDALGTIMELDAKRWGYSE
jgi:DNA polymerase I-like protein with 3'-5' exonuclease and polymerase domains